MKQIPDRTRNITLHDAGGGPLLMLVLSIPVIGSIIDSIWNYVVLTFTLRVLTNGMPANEPPPKPDSNPFWVPERNAEITREDKIIYTIIATIAGFIIDMIFVFIIWDPLTEGEAETWWQPRLNIGLQLLLMIVPITLLTLSNYGLASRFLGLPRKKAWILGMIMAIFTAPWILAIIPRYH